MSIIHRIGVIALLVLLPFAASGMFKCQQPNGSISFQDTPCQENSAQQVLKVDKNGTIKELPTEKPITNQSDAPSLQVKPTLNEPAKSIDTPTSEQSSGSNQMENTNDLNINNSALTQEAPKDTSKNIVNEKVRAWLWLVSFVGCIFIIKLIATMLHAERAGFLTCFVAVLVSVFFVCVFVGLGGALANWTYLSIFASAGVFMVLFKTNYFKGLIISIPTYIAYVIVFELMAPIQSSAPLQDALFSPPDKSFSITMPGVPEDKVGSTSISHSFEFKSPNGAGYQVYYRDDVPGDHAQVLNSFAEMVKGKDGTVLWDKNLTNNGYHSRNVRVRLPNGFINEANIFFNKSRVYFVFITVPKGDQFNPLIDAYLNSFHAN
jgi:hypothetical protein